VARGPVEAHSPRSAAASSCVIATAKSSRQSGRAQGFPANQLAGVALDREGGVWAAFFQRMARVQLDSPYAVHGSAQGLDAPSPRWRVTGSFVRGGHRRRRRARTGRALQSLPDIAGAVREAVVHEDWLFILATNCEECDSRPNGRPRGSRTATTTAS